MTNVVEFPKKELDITVSLENEEERLEDVAERIHALAEILDLNIQGAYHVIDADADEIMMTLLHLAAVWSVRAGIPPEEYEELVRSTRLEIVDDAP